MQSLTSRLVFLSGTFALILLSDLMYKSVKVIYDKKPKKDNTLALVITAEKEVLSTQKNKNPKRQSSIKRERYGVSLLASQVKYLLPLYPLC